MNHHHLYFNPGSQAAVNVHHPYQQNHGHGSSNHHGGRSRRGARFGSSNGNQRQFKAPRPAREAAEVAHATNWRRDFEAARSFDLEDDEIFCPWHLLTEDDLHSIHSSSSERSSSSGDSPNASPPQHQLQPTPTFSLSAAAPAHVPQATMQHSNSSHLKLHQPMAQRARNPIPIVDPNSRHTSPPNSISPNKQAQKPFIGARRW